MDNYSTNQQGGVEFLLKRSKHLDGLQDQQGGGVNSSTNEQLVKRQKLTNSSSTNKIQLPKLEFPFQGSSKATIATSKSTSMNLTVKVEKCTQEIQFRCLGTLDEDEMADAEVAFFMDPLGEYA